MALAVDGKLLGECESDALVGAAVRSGSGVGMSLETEEEGRDNGGMDGGREGGREAGRQGGRGSRAARQGPHHPTHFHTPLDSRHDDLLLLSLRGHCSTQISKWDFGSEMVAEVAEAEEVH